MPSPSLKKQENKEIISQYNTMQTIPLKKLEGEELIAALKQQVEFYFSPQNLPTDVYLRSQMNARHFVSIDTIASFRKVKALTEDRAQLLEAMKKSKKLVVDGTGKLVGPNRKVERTTLILRDIPSSTKPDEIRKIFDDPSCGKVESIRAEVANTWFVTFENEEACTSTAMSLLGKKFKGKPIRCRVKSENPFRSLYWPNLITSPVGQGRGGWKPGQNPPLVPPGVFYPKAGYSPFGQFSPMVGQHQPDPSGQSDRHWKSKRGKQKNVGYCGKNQKPEQPSPDTDPSRPITTGNNSKKVYIKYQQPCLKYNREQMAEIVRKFSKEGFTKPKNLAKGSVSPVIADKQASDSQLLEPMPVMYPASPSPLFAAQPHHSSMPPFLDLGNVSSNPGRGNQVRSILPNSAEKPKKGRSKKSGQKKYAKKPSRKTKKNKAPTTKTTTTKATTPSIAATPGH